ncbi:hypothetical protein IQ249_15015 [Lusitaniella coriacea LEGE 07157]|uniref:Uncharacterized protein n=1 Tax=Lusitaniella coriacea LEGE 07157 TaxID=945747 RepID=A0A8J7E0S1_9CYAN|nr:ribbon-helix-helix domain-containing protein [Lusitaniella coriacea]MBE9117209.1 hypothetical protein [Lusitaniella coriacea LEGE 07157]
MTDYNLENVPPQLRPASAALIEKKGKGLGIKNKQNPVCVMLPPQIDKIVKALPNRSEFIRAAIIEKLAREEGEIASPVLANLEEIRDRVLMTQPPRERKKLKALLDAFITEIKEEQGGKEGK